MFSMLRVFSLSWRYIGHLHSRTAVSPRVFAPTEQGCVPFTRSKRVETCGPGADLLDIRQGTASIRPNHSLIVDTMFNQEDRQMRRTYLGIVLVLVLALVATGCAVPGATNVVFELRLKLPSPIVRLSGTGMSDK